jgi:hypothetical protein
MYFDSLPVNMDSPDATMSMPRTTPFSDAEISGNMWHQYLYSNLVWGVLQHMDVPVGVDVPFPLELTEYPIDLGTFQKVG